MGHLNSFSASGGGNLNKNFQKFKCPGSCPGGMFKLRFDWYIRPVLTGCLISENDCISCELFSALDFTCSVT